MRYQRSFPNVIPHAKVGCSRVTHPSATKLPLSKLSGNSVRLECVMHAASVHPEPGSNSRINCIKITSYEVFQSVRAFFLSFFYFCLSSILFQNFTRSFFALYFCFRFVLLQSLVVQFSMTDLYCIQNIQLYYSITIRFVCQAFFITFLNFFRLARASRVCDLVILPQLFTIVKSFFESFLKIFNIF